MHGDSKWATEKDLKPHYDPGGFMVGWLKRPVFADRESSVLSFAQRGGGKTRGMMASIRKETGNTLLIIDPAGDIYREVAEPLKKSGYEIGRIDLMAAEGRFSPMSFFRHSTGQSINRDISLFCSLAIEGRATTEVSQHFTDVSRNLLGAVLQSELSYIKARTTLAECVEILAADGPHKRRTYFEKLKALPDPIVKMGVHAFEEAGDREKGSFGTTLARRLKPWLDPAIADVCREDPWCWEDVLTAYGPRAIFVTSGIGQSDITGPYMRMMVGLALATAERLYNRTRKKLPRGLRVYVDEADLIGYCPPLVSAVTELRKAGVNVWLNYQSIAQLQKNYGQEEARTMQSNCDWLVVGGMKDDKLYDEVSRMVGDKTETGTSKSRGDHGKGESEHEFARRLIKPDELRRLPHDEIVALLGTLSVRMSKSFTVDRDGVRFR